MVHNSNMSKMLDVAQSFAGGADVAGVAFVVWEATVPRIVGARAWTPTRAALGQELLSRASGSGILVRSRLCAVVECDGTAPRAALVAEGPSAAARGGVLRELLHVLEEIHQRGPEAGHELSGYQAWVVTTEDPRTELIIALEQHAWNVSALADAWGVTRPTIYRNIRKYRVELDRTPITARRVVRNRK